MVGDGINNAPALMQAMVGITMVQVTRESAKIMLIGNTLLRFADTIKISRGCHRIIIQNFCGTLVVDSVGVGLAALGLLKSSYSRPFFTWRPSLPSTNKSGTR
jgi:P-type E1-E2 ATPase